MEGTILAADAVKQHSDVKNWNQFIGARLQNVRKQQAKKQEDVEKALSFAKHSLSLIENGKTPITMDILQPLADYYGYSIHYFLENVPDDYRKELEAFALMKLFQELPDNNQCILALNIMQNWKDCNREKSLNDRMEGRILEYYCNLPKL